jgi:hypothetical protein
VTRFRFSLRGLLIVATVLILFAGYSQKRRRDILESCRQLEADGYVFAIPSGWHDVIWQRRPTAATIVTIENGIEGFQNGSYWIQDDGIGWVDDPNEIARLKRLGFVDYE